MTLEQPLILTFFVFIFTVNLSSAQYSSDANDAIDKSEYETILLDGKLAYKHKVTNEILRDDLNLKAFRIEKEPVYFIDDYTFWDNKKVNPYREEKNEFPFRVDIADNTFAPPVDGKMVITSRFGRRRRGPHRGIDIDLVTGDNVYAMLPGKIRFVGRSSGHGKTVIIRHSNNLETVYAHLSKYTVSVDDYVSKGQEIGKGGRTGNARGSHLHLETRYKGTCIHPEYIFDFENDNKVKAQSLWVTDSWANPKYHNSRVKSKTKVLSTKEKAIEYEKAIPRVYVVRKGDTLGRIAQKQNSSIREICKLNGIRSTSILRIGQHLRVR